MKRKKTLEPVQRDGVMVQAGAVIRPYLTVEQACQKRARVVCVMDNALFDAL